MGNIAIKKSVESNHNVILTSPLGTENTRLAQETAAELLGYVDADGNPNLKALEVAAKGPNRQYLYYRVEPDMKFEDFSTWLEELAKGLQNRAAKTAAAMEEPLIVATIISGTELPTTELRAVTVKSEDPGEFVVVIDGLEQVDWMMAPLPSPALSEKLCFPENTFIIATMTDAALEHSGAVAFWNKHLTWPPVQIGR